MTNLVLVAGRMRLTCSFVQVNIQEAIRLHEEGGKAKCFFVLVAS